MFNILLNELLKYHISNTNVGACVSVYDTTHIPIIICSHYVLRL